MRITDEELSALLRQPGPLDLPGLNLGGVNPINDAPF